MSEHLDTVQQDGPERELLTGTPAEVSCLVASEQARAEHELLSGPPNRPSTAARSTSQRSTALTSNNC